MINKPDQHSNDKPILTKEDVMRVLEVGKILMSVLSEQEKENLNNSVSSADGQGS